MSLEQKTKRYQRIIEQLRKLLTATSDPICRMATVSSLLYHKMRHFFWIGFYRLIDGQLLVGPYQGTIACQKLQKDQGVCWACANQGQSILVHNVCQFPGHIACDPRSQSEIVVPVRDKNGKITAVLDGDSDKISAFDEIDRQYLESIADLIYNV